ncbi:MAG: hypothetical protein M3Q31_06825 [Actinomycetota bacterium]|nr:hypothetical protein [Actinomycetota bacterium]
MRGYTGVTQEHGDEAAAELARAFATTTRAVAVRCEGAVIELRGDEALVVFASARQALRAAVELQEAFAGRSADSTALPLGVGIGVDAGEAVPLEHGLPRRSSQPRGEALCQRSSSEVLASEGVTNLAGVCRASNFASPFGCASKGSRSPSARTPW